MKKRILFIDNYCDFLETRAEFLTMEGYEVIKATSIEEAKEKFNENAIHLIILDIRLVDDDDEKDTSGIELAKSEEMKFVPKIILTNNPTYEFVKETLRSLDGHATALDFIEKKDGVEKMIESINEIFEKRIRINWNLRMVWNPQSMLNSPGLVTNITPEIQNKLLSGRVNEFEDLICALFFNFSQVTFLQSLWIKNRVAALLVSASSQSRESTFLLTCGDPNLLYLEKKKFDTHAPKFDRNNGTYLFNQIRTTNYGANLWKLSGINDTNLTTFEEFWNFENTEKNIKKVINTIFNSVLQDWRNQTKPIKSEHTFFSFYKNKLFFKQAFESIENFYYYTHNVIAEAKALKLIDDITFTEGELLFTFLNKETISLSNPIPYLFSLSSFGNDLIFLRNSPGKLNFTNLILDNDREVWLTDFSESGLYPLYHDFTYFEHQIRAHIRNRETIESLFLFEKELQVSRSLVPFYKSIDVEPELKKAAISIQLVREIASQIVGNHPDMYLQCSYFNLVFVFQNFDINKKLTIQDIIRFLHWLIVAAFTINNILCKQGSNHQKINQAFKPPELEIKTNNVIKIGDKKITLSRTEFDFIKYLDAYDGKVCPREKILENVFQIINPTKDQTNAHINSNLNRIRTKLEPNPSKPVYLITVHGQGIKLTKNPK